MQRNNYSEATKKFSGGIFFLAAPENLSGFSDFVVDDPRRLSPIFGLIDLEVGEESPALSPQKLEHRYSAAANLQLGAFTGSQLQHRSPGTSVCCDDDFRLRGVGKNSSRSLARHFPAMNLIAYPGVALHQVLDESDVCPLRLFDLITPFFF